VLTGGEDYGVSGVNDPQEFTVVIPASNSRGTMLVPIIEDTVVESNETFTLTFAQIPQVCNIVAGRSSTDVTILDNDGKTITVVVMNYHIICCRNNCTVFCCSLYWY